MFGSKTLDTFFAKKTETLAFEAKKKMHVDLTRFFQIASASKMIQNIFKVSTFKGYNKGLTVFTAISSKYEFASKTMSESKVEDAQLRDQGFHQNTADRFGSLAVFLWFF